MMGVEEQRFTDIEVALRGAKLEEAITNELFTTLTSVPWVRSQMVVCSASAPVTFIRVLFCLLCMHSTHANLTTNMQLHILQWAEQTIVKSEKWASAAEEKATQVRSATLCNAM
jgi:hypothetical protein